MRLFFLVLLSCCFSLHASSSRGDFYRTFWYPLYFGDRLAYCSKDETRCGRPIAQAYCQEMGYQQVKTYRIAPNVGQTHYLFKEGECTGWKCDGFLFIGCTGKLEGKAEDYSYRMKTFVFPRVRNHRVAWCYNQNKQCGHRAAYSFCRRIGYNKVQSYEQDKRISATVTLGDHTLCYGPQCRGFKKIVCKR